MSTPSTEFEISDLKQQIERELLDMVYYGVANLRQYPNIVNGWAPHYPKEWKEEVIKKSGPDFSAEQKVYNSKARQNGQLPLYNRKNIAETGFAMEKAPLGPCTVHGIAAADRILRLQEDGVIPANMSVRIVSGQHGRGESHVFVVLDKMPVTGEYLNSTDTTENSIIIDTWYGAQGGPYILSPDDFRLAVGDYLDLGEGTRNLFSVAGRSELQLAEDKEVAKEALRIMENLLAPAIEKIELEEAAEAPVFTAFIKEHNDVIQNFKMADEEQISNLKKAAGLDPRDQILIVKYGMVTGDFDMRVHKYGEDKPTWIGKGDFIARLNNPPIEEATLLDDDVELPPPLDVTHLDDTFNPDDVELPPLPPPVEEVTLLDDDKSRQTREAISQLEHGEIEQPQPSMDEKNIAKPTTTPTGDTVDKPKSVGS
jgi:hypothetical protein